MQASPFERLRTLTGKTRAEFATEAGMSRQAVLNLEAGMYPEVPLRANSKLASLCRTQELPAANILTAEYGQGTLNRAMDVWKRSKRAHTDLRDWPQLTWRELIARFDSPGQFCRSLCIPTSAIYNLQYNKGSAIPDVIREALADAGYQYVEELRA